MRVALIGLAMAVFHPGVASAQTESIESCCTGTANPQGAYGSTDLPRTTFAVTYNPSGAKLQSARATSILASAAMRTRHSTETVPGAGQTVARASRSQMAGPSGFPGRC